MPLSILGAEPALNHLSKFRGPPHLLTFCLDLSTSSQGLPWLVMDVHVEDPSIDEDTYTITAICLWVEAQMRLLPREIREFVAMRLREPSSFRRREQPPEAQRFRYLRELHTMVEAVFGKRRAADFVLPKEEGHLAQLAGQLYKERHPLIQNPSPKFFGVNAYFALPIVIIELMRSVVPSLKKELSQPVEELLESGARKWQHKKPSLEGDTWIWDGSRLLSEYDLEVIQYTQQIAQNPNDAEPYLRRANIWFINKSNYDRAIEDYGQAIRLRPTDAHLYYERGHALRNKGLYREAMGDFNEAIRLCPTEPGYHEGLAICYAQQQDYANAIREYSDLMQLDPRRASQYVLKRAELHELIGQYKEAIDDLQVGAGFPPQDHNVQGQLAKLYKLAGNFEQALLCYGRAIELAKQSEEKVRAMSKEHEQPLRSQLEDVEFMSEWYLARGLLYLESGRRAEALADLNTFVSRSKDRRKVEEITRIIKDLGVP